MTELIYHSDSADKIVAIFAIECAIVFGFIIFLIFCCTGKIFCSKDTSDTNNDDFAFKKYSSINKISNDKIETLYEQHSTKKERKNKLENKSIGTKLTECIFKRTGIESETKLGTKTMDDETHHKISSASTKARIDPTEQIECNKQEKTDVDMEETKSHIDIKNSIILYDTKIKEPDIEQGLNANKIYLVYEFNNLDKRSNPSSYMSSESGDEFDELEEFVNMIIKSFEKNYDHLGILLKISSPGGSAFKFEHAYSNLLRLKNKGIELVGLVDKMAASGGYMLAAACDKIVCAEYATIGSVGVIAQVHNWAELGKKVGLEEKTWTTGSHKNPFPTGTTYTDEDDQRMEELIDKTFNIFKSIVMKSRKFTPEQMEEICMAKTFSGSEALKLNMVDNIELSSDYMDHLNLTNNIWICGKEKKSKNIFNSFLTDTNLKSFGMYLTSKVYNHLLIDKKINGVKLM